MDKLLAILALVTAGCTGDSGNINIDLSSDAATDVGFETEAGVAGDEQEVFITGVGAGSFARGDGDDAGDGDIVDGGVVDGGSEAPAFSILDPDFIESVWWLTRAIVAYECDGETLRDPGMDPQVYDVRIDADHNLYGGIALDTLLWNPGFFEDGVWYPEEILSQRRTWSNPEMRAVDANTMAGTAQYMTGGCSYKDHWSIDMVRDL